MFPPNFRTKFGVSLNKPTVICMPLDPLDAHSLLTFDGFAYKSLEGCVVFEEFCSFRLFFGSHCEKSQCLDIRIF